MTKAKKLIFVPLAIIALLLLYCWTMILLTDVSATWRHYLALWLFAALVFLFRNSVSKATIATGLYLLLATFNLLSMTTAVNTTSFGIGPLRTPPLQMLSLMLFIIYFFLNLDPLINIYLEYKGAKQPKARIDS